MKRIIIYSVLLCTIYSVLLPFVGKVTENLILPISDFTTVVQFIQQPFEATQMSYTNGGLVLIYPTGLFTVQPPLVLVSIQLNGSSQSGFMYLAEVDAVSDMNSCTITVYRLPMIGGSSVEAADNEVDVSILVMNFPGE